jgi:hypothetical protein
MNTALFSNLHNGAVQPATGTSSISLAIGEPPVQFYRYALFMHFPTGGTAEGVRIVNDETNLQVEFSALEFETAQKSEPNLIAALESIDTETIGIQLDTSRKIKKAVLAAEKATGSGYTLGCYDFSGTHVSGEPAKVADVVSGVAELDNAYSASRFALRLKNPAGVGLPLEPHDLLKLAGEQPGPADFDALDTQTRTIDIKLPRRIYRIQFTSGSGILAGSRLEFYRLDLDTPAEKPTAVAFISDRTATLTDEFIAARFAVRIKQSDGAYRHRSHWTIEKVIVHTYPTGPRLGIADPNDLMTDGPDEPSKPVFFWQQPGELRDAVGLRNAADGGRMLTEALQNYLDGTFEGLKKENPANGSSHDLSDTITAALVIESDAPCYFNMTRLEVSYQLIAANTFTSGREKHVLRFTGTGDETQQIALTQPVNTTIMSATLRTVDSFKPQRLLSEQSDQSGDSVIAEKTGAYLGSVKWAAQPITPSQALSIIGVRLGLLVLTENTELQVQLREDWRGQPIGKQLAEARLKPVKIGNKHWANLQFTEVLDLFMQPCWLLCRTTTGDAVWLSRPSDTSMVMLNHPDNQAAAVLEGITALFEWLIPVKPDETGKSNSTVKLQIGDQIVTPETVENDNRTYDLTAPLNAYLQNAIVGSSPVTIPLVFTAAMSGIITVYPPEIDFSINT